MNPELVINEIVSGIVTGLLMLVIGAIIGISLAALCDWFQSL